MRGVVAGVEFLGAGVSLVACFLMFLLGVLSHRLGPLSCTGGRRCAWSGLFLPRLLSLPCLVFFNLVVPHSLPRLRVEWRCVSRLADHDHPTGTRPSHLHAAPTALGICGRRRCGGGARGGARGSSLTAAVGVESVDSRADGACAAVQTLAVGRIVRSWCWATTVVRPSITLAAVHTVGQVSVCCTSSPSGPSLPQMQWTGDGAQGRCQVQLVLTARGRAPFPVRACHMRRRGRLPQPPHGRRLRRGRLHWPVGINSRSPPSFRTTRPPRPASRPTTRTAAAPWPE